jgi:hypothetical protein
MIIAPPTIPDNILRYPIYIESELILSQIANKISMSPKICISSYTPNVSGETRQAAGLTVELNPIVKSFLYIIGQLPNVRSQIQSDLSP